MSHYFVNDETLKHQETLYKVSLFDVNFEFIADKGVFSMEHLDFGSELLIKTLRVEQAKSMLDLGCGVGPIGIITKKVNPNLNVTMCDINHRAVELSKKNAVKNQVDVKILESDAFLNIKDTFDLIVSNPPIRAGKKVIYSMYEHAYMHLNNGGSLWLVVRKQQGAPSTIDFLKTIYQHVEVVERSKGYYIIKAMKMV
jgi:16S rRNA (guanine1207-N2)-methyltransferase